MGTDPIKLRETILNRLNACNGWDKDKFEYIQNLSNDELVTALSGDNAFNDDLFLALINNENFKKQFVLTLLDMVNNNFEYSKIKENVVSGAVIGDFECKIYFGVSVFD